MARQKIKPGFRKYGFQDFPCQLPPDAANILKLDFNLKAVIISGNL
jgi:hypothetical protein